MEIEEMQQSRDELNLSYSFCTLWGTTWQKELFCLLIRETESADGYKADSSGGDPPGTREFHT